MNQISHLWIRLWNNIDGIIRTFKTNQEEFTGSNLRCHEDEFGVTDEGGANFYFFPRGFTIFFENTLKVFDWELSHLKYIFNWILCVNFHSSWFLINRCIFSLFSQVESSIRFDDFDDCESETETAKRQHQHSANEQLTSLPLSLSLTALAHLSLSLIHTQRQHRLSLSDTGEKTDQDKTFKCFDIKNINLNLLQKNCCYLPPKFNWQLQFCHLKNIQLMTNKKISTLRERSFFFSHSWLFLFLLQQVDEANWHKFATDIYSPN